MYLKRKIFLKGDRKNIFRMKDMAFIAMRFAHSKKENATDFPTSIWPSPDATERGVQPWREAAIFRHSPSVEGCFKICPKFLFFYKNREKQGAPSRHKVGFLVLPYISQLCGFLFRKFLSWLKRALSPPSSASAPCLSKACKSINFNGSSVFIILLRKWKHLVAHISGTKKCSKGVEEVLCTHPTPNILNN